MKLSWNKKNYTEPKRMGERKKNTKISEEKRKIYRK